MRVRWSSFGAVSVFMLALVTIAFVGVTSLVISLVAQLAAGTYETAITLLCVLPVFLIMALAEWVVLGRVFNRASVEMRLVSELTAGEGYRSASSVASPSERVEVRVSIGPFVLARGQSWARVGARRVERRVSRGARGSTTYPVYVVFNDGSEQCIDSFDEPESADMLVATLEAERDRLANVRSE